MMKQGTFEFFTEVKAKKTERIDRPGKLRLFKGLLAGNYILERRSHDLKYSHCLYEGKNVPVMFINPKEFKKHKHLLRRKKGAFVLDLKAVRRLHGNSSYKKIYKKNLLMKKQLKLTICNTSKAQ